jgi:nicotinamide-nucleotide amidase
MRAELITIGDELLIGQVVNTNQAYIAEKLTAMGIAVDRMTTVGDTLEPILVAFGEAWGRSDSVIVTGGLGPTHDDVTKKAVCAFFNDRLVSSSVVRENVERLLSARRVTWSAAAEEQTMFPVKATPLANRLGTAAGILMREAGKIFIAMPGVPYEMTAMLDEQAIPVLLEAMKEHLVRHRTLRTTGISESVLSSQLGDIDQLLRGAKLAFLPSPAGVRLRISEMGTDARLVDAKLAEIEKAIRERAGKYIYAAGEVELEEVVGRLLSERQLTIAVAESCTGGLIMDKLTDVSGSSGYFAGGVVAYSNEAKTETLGVSGEMISGHGAVSREVAEAMALGVRRILGTSIGVSTTGIAGPTGGSTEKPVGLVWVGYADESGALAIRFNFGPDRRRIKERATAAALELVRRKISRID